MIVIKKASPHVTCKIDDAVPSPVVVRVYSFNPDKLEKFAEAVDKAISGPQPVVPVVINSWGGYVDPLMAMVDILKSSPKPVVTVAEGMAMSAGSVILSCGHEGMRYAAPNSRVMVHEVSGVAWGKNTELQVTSKETDRLNKHLLRLIAKNTGKPADYWVNIIKHNQAQDVWLTPAQAKKHNLVNHTGVPKMTVNLTAEYEFEG
jgi:ATP-dependent Clp endopeptidase proteolytic subunit ClpP